MTDIEFIEYRKKIVGILHKLREKIKDENAILVGSIVFILNNINLGREINDIDMITWNPFKNDSFFPFEDMKVHILLQPYLEDYDMIEGFKVAKLQAAIDIKNKIGSEKHLGDLNNINNV